MSMSSPIAGLRSLGGLFVFAGAACAPEVVTFGNGSIPQGQRISITSRTESELSISVMFGPKEYTKMDIPGKQEIACTVTITATDKEGASAAQIEFGESKLLESIYLGGVEEREHPCSAQAFDVKRTRKGFEAQGQCSGEQRSRIDDVCEPTLSRPLASALSGKSLKGGESIELPLPTSKLLLALFSTMGAAKCKLTLDELCSTNGVDAAVFEVEALLVSRAAGGGTEMEVVGELAVDVKTLLVVSADLTGMVKVESWVGEGDQRIDKQGQGKTTWKYSAKLD